MSDRWDESDIPSLEGKVALVTGANSGLGLEATKLLAEHGARVLMACRNAEKAGRAVDEVRVDNPEVTTKVTRVTGPFCVEATIPTPSDDEDGDAAADGGTSHVTQVGVLAASGDRARGQRCRRRGYRTRRSGRRQGQNGPALEDKGRVQMVGLGQTRCLDAILPRHAIKRFARLHDMVADMRDRQDLPGPEPIGRL